MPALRIGAPIEVGVELLEFELLLQLPLEATLLASSVKLLFAAAGAELFETL